MNVIILKCPVCGVKLKAVASPSLAGKIATCPKCGHKGAYESFKDNCETVVNKGWATSGKAYLVYDNTGAEYPLADGLNSVGRYAANSSKADIKIITTDSSLSRKHANITVNKVPDGQIICSISNAENKFKTFVNGIELENGDVLVVNPGDKIKMASSVFHIEIK
jgi:hypothetical protein